jgi:hypothetical protein
MTNAMNIKTVKGKILMIAVLLLGAVVAIAASPKSAEAAEYQYAGYDWLTTQTTHAGLATSQRGYVQWYLADRFPLPDIYRGEYKNTYVTDRGTGVGCIYAKVTWHHATGSVSWPPSASGSMTSDGFYRSCRASGQAHAYRINLSGVNYASSSLYATTLTICHSSFASTPKVCSSNKYYLGGSG